MMAIEPFSSVLERVRSRRWRISDRDTPSAPGMAAAVLRGVILQSRTGVRATARWHVAQKEE
jgi:hypothetical protein